MHVYTHFHTHGRMALTQVHAHVCTCAHTRLYRYLSTPVRTMPTRARGSSMSAHVSTHVCIGISAHLPAPFPHTCPYTCQHKQALGCSTERGALTEHGKWHHTCCSAPCSDVGYHHCGAYASNTAVASWPGREHGGFCRPGSPLPCRLQPGQAGFFVQSTREAAKSKAN